MAVGGYGPGTHNGSFGVSTSPQAASSFSIGKPITYATSGSAFKQQDASGPARGTGWDASNVGKQEQGGVMSRLTDMVFGW